MAKTSRRLLELLDDTPVVPGAERAAYENERVAKEILIDAEEELGKWEPSQDSYSPSARLENNLLPSIGNGSVQSDTHSVTGDANERGHKMEATNDADASADTHDPKVLEIAT